MSVLATQYPEPVTSCLRRKLYPKTVIEVPMAMPERARDIPVWPSERRPRDEQGHAGLTRLSQFEGVLG